MTAVLLKPQAFQPIAAQPIVATTAPAIVAPAIAAPASLAPANPLPPRESVAVVPAKPETPKASRVGQMLRDLLTAVVPPLIVLALMLVAWEISCAGPKSALPAPSRIWLEAKDLIVSPFFINGPQDIGLGWRVLTSLQRVAIGFGIAAVFGVLIGAFVGQSVWAMRGLDPIFQVLRTVPPLAWLPLSLAAFREAQPSAIFVIFITSIWPIIINTAVGVRNVPQDYRNVAAVIRLKGPSYFLRIVLPAAAPFIFTGLRIGVGLSWLAIVAAEMLTGRPGVGGFLWQQYNALSYSHIILCILTIGVVGYVLDRLMSVVENRLKTA